MTTAEFEQLVAAGLDRIPEKFQALMENVVVVVEEHPRGETASAVGIERNHILLGLYEGIPQTKRGPHYAFVPPDKITLFQKPIEAVGATPEGIRELVYETVWHEVGHHFGLDDASLKLAEKRRRKNGSDPFSGK